MAVTVRVCVGDAKERPVFADVSWRSADQQGLTETLGVEHAALACLGNLWTRSSRWGADTLAVAGGISRNCKHSTFRNVCPHTYMVQSRPGLSMRLHHNKFDSEHTLQQAATVKLPQRPTHAARAQLMVDADVAGHQLIHAWVGQSLQSGKLVKEGVRSVGTQQARRVGAQPCGVVQVHAPGGSEFQIAAMEVCIVPSPQPPCPRPWTVLLITEQDTNQCWLACQSRAASHRTLGNVVAP